MSEGSKMGLFGSKDDKKESTSTDTDTKPDSPDRYAPYCIDSDSETYDTEALSIMDINDIIGVQTGGAVESTLESEIAALTEIMTDSKGDTNSDTINEIDGESSDIKFNDELLTEFTSLSPSENPVPTTSKEGFHKGLIVDKLKAKNIEGKASDKPILEITTSVAEKIGDSTLKDEPEVKTNIKIIDEVETEAENDAFGSVKRDNETRGTKLESGSEKEATKESLLSSGERSFDDLPRNDEVLATEGEKLAAETDTVTMIESSKEQTIPQVATGFLDKTLEAVKTNLEDKSIEHNKDSSTCGDVSTASVENTTKSISNVLEDVDSVLKSKSEAEEAVDDPVDSKDLSGDVSTASVEDATKSISNVLEDVDSVLKSKSQAEEAVDDPEDNKDSSGDVSTASVEDTAKSISNALKDVDSLLKSKSEAGEAVHDSEYNKDSCGDAPAVSVEDAAKSISNVLEVVDSILKPKSEEEDEVDDPEDEELEDVLTNVGSTSKSLQLIGEAYISEDSQEIDETDESPRMKVASVPLDNVKDQEKEEIDNEPQQKDSSDNASTNTMINEIKTNVIADAPENATEKYDSDNHDSASLEDNKESDNTKETLLNLQDNIKGNRKLDPSDESQINVESQVIEEDKSVDPSMQNEENTDRSNESVEVTSLPIQSIVPGSSNIPKITSMTESLETKEEPLHESEQLADISSNSGAETVQMTTEDGVLKLETNRNSEELRKEMSNEAELLDEAMHVSKTDFKKLDSNTETAVEVNDSSTEDPEPLEKLEALSSIASACSTTESKNIIEMDSEMQIKDTNTQSVEQSERIDEQDNTASIGSNNEKELLDSQSNQESTSSLQHSIGEDKFAERDSQSSILPVSANSEDEENQSPTTNKSARNIISAEEQSKERSEDVDQLLETMQDDTEERIVVNTIIEKDTSLGIQVGNEKIEDKDEGSSIHKMFLSIKKEQDKINSERSKLCTDDATRSTSMEITSPIVEETSVDSSNNMPTNEADLAVEESNEKIDEAENLGAEFDQSASMSSIENDVPANDIMETNKQEESVEEDLRAERDNSTGIETVQLPKTELSENEINVERPIGFQGDTPGSKTLSSIITQDVPDPRIETTSEDITPVDVESSSLEIVEPNTIKDNLDKEEIIEKSQESEEIDKAERVDFDTQVESSISGTDGEEASKTQVSDKTQQSKENESISELSDDTEKKQAKDTLDKDGTQIEETKVITEPSTVMVSENTSTVVELETVPEVSTMQDPLELNSPSQSKPEQKKDEEELKIQPIQNQGDGIDVLESEQELDNQSESERMNDEIQCQKLSQPTAECSSGDVNPDGKSESLTDVRIDEKQNGSEIELEKPGNNADLRVVLDKSIGSVPCEKVTEDLNKIESETHRHLPENSAEKTSSLEIGSEELPEMESKSTALIGVSKLLETDGELQEDKLLPTQPVDDTNLDETVNIQSSEEKLELGQTLTGMNEIEDDSGGAVLSLIDEIAPIALQSDNLTGLEVKMDVDLQCEPIEELEKLAVVADEILIDELANSVLKDTTLPLENISNLDILPDSLLSTSIIVTSNSLINATVTSESSEINDQPVLLLGEVNETCFIENSNPTPSVSQGADYMTDVIISSTNMKSTQLTDNITDTDDKNLTADEFEQKKQAGAVKTGENLISTNTTSIDQSITSIHEASLLEVGENLVLDKDIEIDLPLKEVEEKLIECAVLACDTKIDLPDEVLFDDAENAEQTDVLCRTPADNADTSQQSSEFSELECAVKFLQESEEQTIDSPLLLSPKIAEETVEENSEQSKSCLFLSETEVCQETLELPVELEEEITPDSIAISEAEIISEAAKLESERKLKIAAETSKSSVSIEKSEATEEITLGNSSEMLKSLLTTSEVPSWQGKSEETVASTSGTYENTQIPKLSGNIIRRSEKIPKISILEERLKEPPKIEIPVPEVSPRISDTPTTPKTSLLIQRDSRIDTKTMYQKMLESPKGGDKSEPRIVDTPRKDPEKYEFENVGSPRIILKIAKSAIADCAEPRSPKSPKIRSAANSPNPEDSPGQKLGKIKLKLSKGGHPSIISNENYDETAPRHTEAILSPSHIGMKIKLSKTGDASIIQPEKHDTIDELKESKHKFGEASPKRIESPLGMKIKLSKTGDPSIVQQESKDSTSKRKDKLDIGQEIPKRTDSPFGMKIKLSKSGDASIIQPEKQETSEDAAYRDKFEMAMEIPKRTDSPIGMKIKLSKTGDASIISSDNCEEFKDSSSKCRDKLNTNQDIPKRTDSPLGMKFKLSKSGGASIIQPDKPEAFDDFRDKSENIADITKRVESPIGMKIKLLKTGDASIIHPERQESEDHRESIIIKHREKPETQDIHKRIDSPLGMRIKVTKTGEASVVPQEEFSESFDIIHEVPKRNESPIGMKIKLSKSGDASIIHPEKQEFYDESKDSRGSSSTTQEGSKPAESSLGMKIKLSKTGDASIIHPEISPESKDSQMKRAEKLQSSGEGSKRTDSPLGMKIKLSKTGDASIIEPDRKEKPTTKQKEKLTNTPEGSQKRKEMEYPLEMKIKLSKTGHPTIIANEKQEALAEMHSKSKDHSEGAQSTHKRTETMSPSKESQLRIFKTGHSTIIQSSRSEVTIEPIQILPDQPESSMDISSKCKDVIISPVDLKKSKLEAKLSHILPEVTIQPVMSGEQKQIILDKKSSSISRQQMSVINQEISITHVSPVKPADLSMSGKLKEILRKNATNSPANSDCEIIEHRPELIIVNENSNSSQDIMIIEEVKAPPLEVKVPRKRGRPKRSSLPPLIRQGIPQDPLALDNMQPSAAAEPRESDRPKRTCRNQKSYAPPKRGRGRGRGKRKMDRVDCAIGKIPRLEDPLTAIERSTMSLIAPLQPRMVPEATAQTSELYKALKQGPMDRKRLVAETVVQHGFPDPHKKLRLDAESGQQLASDFPAVPMTEQHSIAKTALDTSDPKAVMISEMLQFTEPVSGQQSTEKLLEAPKPEVQETKNIISDMTTTEHQNWLTPSIKLPESTGKTEAISMVQVMDEETRMSAESNSRSQTPARNISAPVVETVIINEESQGSVLSTATTESEKVKVKNRRMEINFDPDEGPFTVDKIAEYEWPPDIKGDTFMLQEQISQYLGVKSFKRKYPDLKRRMVEMEERNYLRENCLVSEAMCDMGLTAICSTEVLDIMCSDFPDQYEEYRKHMREKQAKEHSKKQKELTAAANAERNRIDLAEMAVQSALSWNVNFNKARKESRKYSLDLQSFTIHVPKKQLKVAAERKASNYPVALIPGQYTDYYREYTPAELRYYPLNTVLYGPMRPNERKFDSQSEGSQSDSDSDSSSDDSSSSSSEGTQDTEESQSTVDDVDMEISAHKEDNKNLKCKMCLKHLNKHGKAEVLIQCGTCNGNVHPSCIDLTLDMVPHIQGYSWQCTDCKTCVQCHNPADEDKMLFCDMCDRGYHIYCVGLRRVPQGRWHCRECAVCASCGLRQPGGANSDRNSVAQWQHEYKKGERNTRVYVSTLCVPCSKLWRKGRYCPHCSRCHSAQRLDLEPNLVHCGACDKYLHLGCVEIRSGTLDRKNYICECCSTPSQLSRSLMSKNFKT